jgi:acetyl esterase/lipase
MPTQNLPGEPGNPRDPFVSPLSAGLAGLPPLYIQAWSDETLLEDSRLFADRARQGGADVRVDLFPGQQHTFQMAVGRSKDADEAMRRLVDLARPKLGP